MRRFDWNGGGGTVTVLKDMVFQCTYAIYYYIYMDIYIYVEVKSKITLVEINDLYKVALHCSLTVLHRSRDGYEAKEPPCILCLVQVSHIKPCMRVCRHVHVFVLSITAYGLIQPFNNISRPKPTPTPYISCTNIFVCQQF